MRISYGWIIVALGAVSLELFMRELASFYALSLMFGFAYGGVMPLYAILVREYFGAWIMGTIFGSYSWLYIGSFGIGLGAVVMAFTFRAPRRLPTTLRAPSVAH